MQKKPIVVVIGEQHTNYNGINTLLQTLVDLQKVNNKRKKNDQITYSWGIEGIGKPAMGLKVIKSEIHIKPKVFSKHMKHFYELENIMKPDSTMPKFDKQWGTSISGVQARNNIQVGDITAQKTDVIIAVVGDAHRDGNKYKEYGYDKIKYSVPDLLKEKGYEVLDYDATEQVHSNISKDVIKKLDEQKANSHLAEVKRTGARKFVSCLGPFFCYFGRC